MKKTVIIIGILSLFLFAGKVYACCIDNENHCNYPNCNQTGVHYHHNETTVEETNTPTYYKCEVEGCHNTEPHTHRTATYNTSTNCAQNHTNRTNNHHGRHHH